VTIVSGSPRAYLARSVRSVTRAGAGARGPLYTVCSGWMEKARLA
jgi:hypothetical protein